MASTSELVDGEKWDKLKSWQHVQDDITRRLQAPEKYDHSLTLYHGPQLYYTMRHSGNIKSMTHFTSTTGEMFVSHYKFGTTDVLSCWHVDTREREAKCVQSRFEIQSEVTSLLYVPKHRIFLGFCSDMELRIYTDASSKCTEKGGVKCSTTILSMAYNRELDEVYLGGIGTLQRWKVTGAEHAATAAPTTGFQVDIGAEEWVIDIKVDTRNKQVLVLTYHNVFVINYETQKQTHHLQNRHDGSLKCCCFYKQREYFITGGGDGAVKVWNAVVFTQVHAFYGHRDAITGLAVHKKDPLLFSSSLDGSVQIWRMDNFSKLMRFDVGEKIFTMKLIGDEQFFCQTEKEIRIYNLNQFYHLFAPVESTVHHLQLCQGSRRIGIANRIIASTEDGSVRLFSPLTGVALTLIYPMPSFQVLNTFAYNRHTDKLLTVLENGEVMSFNCMSNPCKACEVWQPYSTDEGVVQMVQITLEYTGKNKEPLSDVAVFGGLRNGQISLLDAKNCEMLHSIQAHSGDVTCMEYTTEIDDSGFVVKESSRTLVTGGRDNFVKIWGIEVSPGRKKDCIEFNILLKIQCHNTPSHVSMYENTLCVALQSASNKGNLQMYRVEGSLPSQEGVMLQYTQLQHAADEDHDKKVTALDKCPLLGLFASVSEDGYVKIWNRHNQLIREMSFGTPLYGLCFANARGDLLIGFHSHVCSIPLTSYFPQNYLERIVLQDFQDDLRENPIPYNNKVKPWFDPLKLPKFSTTLSQRLQEKNKKDNSKLPEVVDLEGSNAVKEGEAKLEVNEEEQVAEVEEKEEIEENKENKKDLGDKEIAEDKEEEDEGIEDDDEDFEFEIMEGSPDLQSVKSNELMKDRQKQSSRMERKRSVSERTTPNNLNQLTPWERELLKRKKIIPTDGYVPNSVVRKRLGFVRPATPPARKNDIWTLKPVPKADPRHLPHGYMVKDEDEAVDVDELAKRFGFDVYDTDSDDIVSSGSGSSEENNKSDSKAIKLMPCNQKRIQKKKRKKKKVNKKRDDDTTDEDEEKVKVSKERRVSLLLPGQNPKEQEPFIWDNGEDEDESRKVVPPWKRMGSMIRAGSTLSNASSKRGSKLSRRSTPVTPKFELRSKKFEFGGGGHEVGTPDSSRMRRKSGGPRSRERSKSFRLTHMVVDEHSTDVTYKDGPRSGKRVSMLGAADLDCVKRLLTEDWFADTCDTPSFDGIMQRLLTLLDTEDSELHKRICNYILELQRDIGIPDMYLDRVINRLASQLGSPSSSIKQQSILTLKEIGASQQEVVASLLPRLVDSQSGIRDLAAEVLADLVGVQDKDDLYDLMQEMGVTREYNSKEDEEEALKSLAMRLDVPYRSESFNDWINGWVNESNPDMYEDDLKLDDIGRHWDKRSVQRFPESLCMTESTSRASNRLRELTNMSDRSACDNDNYKISGIERHLTFDSDLSFTDAELPDDLLNDVFEGEHYKSLEKPTLEEGQSSDVTYKSPRHGDLDTKTKLSKNDQIRGSHGEETSVDLGFESMYTGVGTHSDGRSDRLTPSTIARSKSTRLIGQDLVEINESFTNGSEVRGHTRGESEDRSLGGNDKYNLPNTGVGNFANGKTNTKSGNMQDVNGQENVDFDNLTDARWDLPTPDDGRFQRNMMLDDEERDAAILKQIKEDTNSLTPVSSRSSKKSRFDPRDPRMYQYYKKRYPRHIRPGSGRRMYGGIDRFPGGRHIPINGKFPVGMDPFDLAEDGGLPLTTDEFADPLSFRSEFDDKSSDASGDLMTAQDSGIGREFSETISSKSSQNSLQGVSNTTLHRPRKKKHRSRHDFHKHALSPVKSSSSFSHHSDVSTPKDKRNDVNWHKFFMTPTAMERKRMEMVKKEFSTGKIKSNGPAVFNYIATDLPMLPGEAGLRLLHTVRVGDKENAVSYDGRHRVESIPGKLMVETKNEDTGKSNFGILQMQWTTGVPNYYSVDDPIHKRRSGTLSHDAISELSETPTERLSAASADTFPKLESKSSRSKKKGRKNADQMFKLPDIPSQAKGNRSTDFKWEHPLPPPPAKDSRTNIAQIRKAHDKYCKHYDLTKKKMHCYTSVSKYLRNIELFAQMANIDERGSGKSVTSPGGCDKKCVTVGSPYKKLPGIRSPQKVLVKTQ